MKRNGKHRKHWWTKIEHRATVMIAELFDEYFFDCITRDRRANRWPDAVPVMVS
ncbi:hypothetical protein SEA_LAHIRIUM_44 [Gordonia phage Lahirium]|uniref:Uncharacterized protein n=6 Tax=Woesvirus woes TaxID=1982751 RepID=A0A2H4PG86_9CAUD|nr:hypothetical protein SEA_ANAMIKA_44 [Gordonia phage Anamika]AVP43228.1 hypothetical protein PBI_HAIL2PITT_43 [Gordonia phage Hail2Pitt]QAX94327.1 hypothetical protein SEA_GUILLAUME_44 [Gordonia phage Guillaume]QAX95313.1 hypothetical protein SEA_HELLO_44 [Gordonia phage Hello]QBP30322.1 hypothetical protein SEA_JORMUNGANDR_44 [Gordonia phage Jormungandr]QBP30617.1 hypothetical protein SEA_LAHIRIUM_44 [Gordonia phage Lahirium]